MHMRVHTFIHQYQYRCTNTEGYDDASIMFGDFYTLTTSKVSTWAVPATRPMEPSFRQKSFQKPSILSAQAAGSASPPGPRSKNFTLFLEWFSDARVYRLHIQTHSGAALFLQRQTSEYKSSYRVRGIGASSGTRFCMYCPHNYQSKKQKLKQTQVSLRTVSTMKHLTFSQRAPKCFIVITVLNKTCVFFTFCFFVLFILVTVHAKAGP